jgi:hypothetical protein
VKEKGRKWKKEKTEEKTIKYLKTGKKCGLKGP